MTAHAGRQHCELSPSSAHRWMACPGSVALSRQVPKRSSSYADEGTAAHELAEHCLRHKVEAASRVGEEWVDSEGECHQITPEMAEAVQMYVDAVRAIITHPLCVWYAIEQPINLEPMKPPVAMHGTSDFTAICGGTLEVIDYKHGQGVAVEVENNAQLRYYALGAYLSLPQEQAARVRDVKITIVQPRAYHPAGAIRTESIPLAELVDFAQDLFDLAEKALDLNPGLVPGDHCKFCPAKGLCPARTEQALAIAQTEFQVISTTDLAPNPPKPELLTLAQLADFVPKFDAVEDWMTAVRKEAFQRLQGGEVIPGLKLVQKRGTRQWKDTQELEKWALANGTKVYEENLMSPAGLEKLVGKKNFPADLAHTVSSGLTMATADDPRPAVNIIQAADDFGVI